MTISTVTVKDKFIGDGVGGPLNTSLRAYSVSEVEVWAFNNTAAPIGIWAANTWVLLTKDTHYTISIGAPLPSTLTVTPITPATNFPAGLIWAIVRRVPSTQLTDYIANDEMEVEAHERAVDRNTMLSQLLDFYRQRSIHLAAQDENLSMELAPVETRKGKLLFFDSVTGAITYVAISTITPGGVAFTAIGEAIAEAVDADAVLALIGAVENDGNARHLRADVIANRPAAAAFGLGLFLATDERRLYFSDSANWFEEVIQSDTFATLSVAAGRVGIATDRKQLYRGDGAAKQLIRSLPPRYLRVDDVSGAYITKSAAQSIQVVANLYGRATLPAASSDQLDWKTTGAITKTIGGTWAAGSGNAGLAAGVAAVSTWYHVFALTQSNGSVDIGFDTNVDGSALLANAAVIAAGYTHAQLIFSIRTQDTDGGTRTILDFIQAHNWVHWKNLIATELDNNGSANGCERRDAAGVNYTAGVQITLRRVPPGYRCEVRGAVNHLAGSGLHTYRPGDAPSVAVNAVNPPDWPPALHWSGVTPDIINQWRTLTDTSARILVTSEAAGGADDQLRLYVFEYWHPLYG